MRRADVVRGEKIVRVVMFNCVLADTDMIFRGRKTAPAKPGRIVNTAVTNILR